MFYVDPFDLMYYEKMLEAMRLMKESSDAKWALAKTLIKK